MLNATGIGGRRRYLAAVFAGIAVLGLALYLRVNALWLPHWKGDQGQYLALAMKLDKRGLDGYNFREVQFGILKTEDGVPIELGACRLGSPGQEGDLLRILRSVGLGYYDEPLHMRAPLFPYALVLAHRLFSNGDLYITSITELGESVKRVKPGEIFRAQAWAAAVPLFWNLLNVALVWVLGWRLFGCRVGLVAAFILATHPLSLFTAHLLLAEDMAVFLLTAAFFVTWECFFARHWLFMAPAGALFGLALLTKQTAGFGSIAMFVYAVLASGKKAFCVQKAAGLVFDRRWLIFMFAALAVSFFWFAKVMEVYGRPFYMPGAAMEQSHEQDVTGWFSALQRRPHPLLFFSLGLVWISPVFALLAVSFRDFLGEIRGLWLGRISRSPAVFLWVWVLVYFLWLTQPWRLLTTGFIQEHRYFYFAYPAATILVAHALEKCRRKLKEICRSGWMAEAAVAAVLILNAFYAAPLGLSRIFENNLLF